MIRNAVDQLREVLVERDELRAENYRLTIAVQDASTKHKILREFDSKTVNRLTKECDESMALVVDLQTGLTEARATIARMRTGRS